MRGNNILEKCESILSEVNDAPAFSCVEYYFIPWLKAHFPIEKLYPRTIVSYSAAEDAILKEGYVSLKCIPRIQDLAEQTGLIRHEYEKYDEKISAEACLTLLRVTPQFFRGKQFAWRGDHYVRLVSSDRRYHYVVNEYPAEIRRIKREESNWREGTCLRYFYKGGTMSEGKVDFTTWGHDSSFLPTMIEFRDAVMTYRISLKRLKAFLGGNQADELLSVAERTFLRSALAAKRAPDDRTLVRTWKEELLAAERKFLYQRGMM